ncbi:MAG TPA: 16S rRNA (cytosine(1402)-N(4))-methyltransferase [Candidatus Magasanikbacteria bacterium]|nr:16S rRNA (cytosine(1402)-N(4))-methyltransferase [Candidatus Magasanikbacteria bacterium]
MRHIPVLLNEVIEGLQLQSGMHVIDCTLGDAGHSEKILEQIGTTGKLLGIDADPEAILRAKQYLYKFDAQVIFVRNNFINLKTIVEENKFNPINGILMDFGWSTPQFEERGRGFSFEKTDELLDMRYGSNFQFTIFNLQNPNVSDLINSLDGQELEKIFREYGEEKLSKEIAKMIVEIRKEKNIKTVGDLVEIILKVYRTKLKTDKEIPWVGGLHPATKTFQALRIAVNNEFGVIEDVLPQAIEVLHRGGRLAVITFHSLEDRIVKHYFKSQENKTIKLINKKPVVCTEEEYKNNPRARSAKLRVIEKL